MFRAACRRRSSLLISKLTDEGINGGTFSLSQHSCPSTGCAESITRRLPYFCQHLPIFYIHSDEKLPTDEISPQADGSCPPSGPKAAQLFESDIHPAVIRTGILMRNRQICGGNSRTSAMLIAFIRFFEDYIPLPYKTVEKHLETELNKQFNFLTFCRPHNMSMGCALRYIKSELHSKNHLGAEELIRHMINVAYHFVQERTCVAAWRIAKFTLDNLLKDGDHIMVLGNSTAVRLSILFASKVQHKRLRVIVVDTAPHPDAHVFARKLHEEGIEMTYALFRTIPSLAQQCTYILIGATAVLSSGAILNRVGSSSLASIGLACGKCVYILAESYKFTERVISNPFASNMLDDPRRILTNTADANMAEVCSKVNPMNIAYDTIGPSSYTGVITELGYIPRDNVPLACVFGCYSDAVLREIPPTSLSITT